MCKSTVKIKTCAFQFTVIMIIVMVMLSALYILRVPSQNGVSQA